MDVILLERIETLGQMGDVVTVKPGYARNYLLPKGKALRATEDNVARFEQQRDQLVATNAEQRGGAEVAARDLEGYGCVLLRQASDATQLYGSVTARDIAEAVSASGVKVARQQVLLDRPIKALGIYPVRVALHPEVTVTVTVNVARTSEEAQAQELAAARATQAPAEAASPAVEEVAEVEITSEAAEAFFETPPEPEPAREDGDGNDATVNEDPKNT